MYVCTGVCMYVCKAAARGTAKVFCIRCTPELANRGACYPAHREKHTNTILGPGPPPLCQYVPRMFTCQFFQPRSSSQLIIREAQQKTAKSLGPATYTGNLDGTLASWSPRGLVLAVVAIWGMNQWMEELSLQINRQNLKNKNPNVKLRHYRGLLTLHTEQKNCVLTLRVHTGQKSNYKVHSEKGPPQHRSFSTSETSTTAGRT